MLVHARQAGGGWTVRALSLQRTGWRGRGVDGTAGLLTDRCSRGVGLGRRLTDGAGGFLPGVPLGCLRPALRRPAKPQPS